MMVSKITLRSWLIMFCLATILVSAEMESLYHSDADNIVPEHEEAALVEEVSGTASKANACTGDCAKALKEFQESKAGTGSTRVKHMMDTYEWPSPFFTKTDFDGKDIYSKGFKVKDDKACSRECAKQKLCEYWTYATSGRKKGTCWIKFSAKGVESQDNRVSGYYDPCMDESNFEDTVDYQGGSDLVQGGITGIRTPAGCCRKCIATKGCKYWTLGKDRNTCWVKSDYNEWQTQSNRASGTFVVNKDGSFVKPDPSKNAGKIKKTCEATDRGFKGTACVNKCEKGSHHTPWCYTTTQGRRKWAHCTCGAQQKKKKKTSPSPPPPTKKKKKKKSIGRYNSCVGDCAKAKKLLGESRADKGPTRAKNVMDSSKPKTFFTKTYIRGPDIKKAFKVKGGAKACAAACANHKTCEYWVFGTSGRRKDTCWVKASASRVEGHDQRDSGYYDPCLDKSNFEDAVDYQGSDLVNGGFKGISTPADCCRKCIATKGCKYWTLGKDKQTCWVKKDYRGWYQKSNRASGTFVVKKDGSFVKPTPSKKTHAVRTSTTKKKKASKKKKKTTKKKKSPSKMKALKNAGKIKKTCEATDRGFKGTACVNKCEKGSHHTPWCYTNTKGRRKWAHCKCGAQAVSTSTTKKKKASTKKKKKASKKKKRGEIDY